MERVARDGTADPGGSTRPARSLGGSLRLYDAMCRAIDACHDVDEVHEIRSQALALEEYDRQAIRPARQCSRHTLVRADRRWLCRSLRVSGVQLCSFRTVVVRAKGVTPLFGAKYSFFLRSKSQLLESWRLLVRQPRQRSPLTLSARMSMRARLREWQFDDPAQ
jgi:hypothetical protein